MFSIGHVGGVERSATIAWSYLNVATTVGTYMILKVMYLSSIYCICYFSFNLYNIFDIII